MSLEKCGEVITLTEAKSIVAKFQTANPTAHKCHMVDIEMIRAIINQPACTGIRFYKGIDNEKETLVLIGVDADRKDMTSGVIVDRSIPCPDKCDEKSELYIG